MNWDVCLILAIGIALAAAILFFYEWGKKWIKK